MGQSCIDSLAVCRVAEFNSTQGAAGTDLRLPARRASSRVYGVKPAGFFPGSNKLLAAWPFERQGNSAKVVIGPAVFATNNKDIRLRSTIRPDRFPGIKLEGDYRIDVLLFLTRVLIPGCAIKSSRRGVQSDCRPNRSACRPHR